MWAFSLVFFRQKPATFIQIMIQANLWHILLIRLVFFTRSLTVLTGFVLESDLSVNVLFHQVLVVGRRENVVSQHERDQKHIVRQIQLDIDAFKVAVSFWQSVIVFAFEQAWQTHKAGLLSVFDWEQILVWSEDSVTILTAHQQRYQAQSESPKNQNLWVICHTNGKEHHKQDCIEHIWFNCCHYEKDRQCNFGCVDRCKVQSFRETPFYGWVNNLEEPIESTSKCLIFSRRLRLLLLICNRWGSATLDIFLGLLSCWGRETILFQSFFVC